MDHQTELTVFLLFLLCCVHRKIFHLHFFFTRKWYINKLRKNKLNMILTTSLSMHNVYLSSCFMQNICTTLNLVLKRFCSFFFALLVKVNERKQNMFFVLICCGFPFRKHVVETRKERVFPVIKSKNTFYGILYSFLLPEFLI